MRRERVLDVTSGPIFGKLLLFALPLIATGLLQCTFNAADIVVAGKFAEEGALAAVGATGSFVSLLVNFFMGLSVGVTIAVSHALGGKQMQEAGDHVHNAIATALCCGLIILVLGELFARPVLTLLKTPEGPVMEGALQYLRIYFLGSPAFLVYNFGAALLRTSGDTRRPMYFLTLAGVANAGMNLFFVLGLGWRTVQMAAAGVALATILSHYVSAICVLVCLFRSRNFLRLEVQRIRIHPRLFRRILVLGVPAGIQSSLFSISNIMLQSNINSFGAIAMAGNTAAVSLESFAGTAMDAFQQSSVTFIGQNKGAGRYDRFVGVWRTNLLTAMVSSLLLGMALYAAGTFMFIFTGLQTHLVFIIAALVVTGLGFAMFSSPNTNAVMSCVEKEDYGVASSILATMRSIGHTFSMVIVTITVTVLASDMALADVPADVLIKVIRVSFIVFTAICIAGVFISLKRE